MNNSSFGNLLNIFNRFSIQQKFIFGLAAVVSAAILVTILIFMNEPNYSVLFSGLSQEDASKVVQFLQSKKIDYELDESGNTIKVDKAKVYETRLALAGEGIPNSGIVGYEIFDKSTIGMSEFMQKLSFKRALEGELAKTIRQQDGVEGVRVHIVIPQKSVFRDEEKKPTASVVLKLRNNYEISQSKINAIVNLVSSSVEGLEPSKVALLDTKGELLSKQAEDNSITAIGSKRYEIKQSVEKYLASKAQSILDDVLGKGNAIVKINADLNFDQVEKTMESYDPDSQVAISEQTIKSENTGKSLGDSTGQSSQNSTINYELSKTVERVVQGSGNIVKLSVAAVINNIQVQKKVGDSLQTVSMPRTEEQLTKLENIIKNAVGVDPSRNDQFSIVNIPFETKQMETLPVEETSMLDNPNEWMNIIVMLAAIIAALIVIKGLMTKLKNEKIVIGTLEPTKILETKEQKTIEQPHISPAGKLESLQSSETDQLDKELELDKELLNASDTKRKVVRYVSKNPSEAAKIINAWLHENE